MVKVARLKKTGTAKGMWAPFFTGMLSLVGISVGLKS
jgi:hypothetical protein